MRRAVAMVAFSLCACSLSIDLAELSGRDAGALEDASRDAGLCARTPPPFLCADFDDGRSLDKIFPFVNISNAIALVDENESRSAPRSLGYVLQPSTSRCELAKALPPTFDEITAELDVKVLARGGSTEQHDFLTITNSEGEVTLAIKPDGELILAWFPFGDGGFLAKDTSLGAVAGPSWRRYRVVITMGAMPSWSVAVDGVLLANITSPRAPFTNARLGIGERLMIGSASDWVVRVDNLLVQVQ